MKNLLLSLLRALIPPPEVVEGKKPEGPRPPPPPPPPENFREAFRRGCHPWNYCRPHMNADLINQLDYLIDRHGPEGLARRLQELADRKAKPGS